MAADAAVGWLAAAVLGGALGCWSFWNAWLAADALGWGLMGAVFAASPAVPIFLRRHRDRLRRGQLAALQQQASAARELEEQVAQLKRQSQALESEIVSIIELYRLTKEASPVFNVQELFRVLHTYLEHVLPVRWVRLLMLRPDPASRLALGTVLSTPIPEPLSPELNGGPDGAPSPFDQALLALIQQHPEAPAVTLLERPPRLVGHEPYSCTLLRSGGTLIGILVISGVTPAMLTSYLILIHQLALHLGRIALYEQVEALAVTDGLTQLTVRRRFLERCAEELRRAQRDQRPLAFIVVDLDYFKRVNDQYGHLVGDVVLKTVAKLLRSHVREIDLVARYGGEEFAVALVDTELDKALVTAERMRAMVEQEAMHAYDETVNLTLSCGVAVFPNDGATVEQLLEHADQALYRAKALGRNRVVSYA